MEEPLEPVYQNREGIFELQIRSQQPFRGNVVMLNELSFVQSVKKGKLTTCKALLYDINKVIEAKDLKNVPWRRLFQNSIMNSYRCVVKYWLTDYHRTNLGLIMRFV